MTIDIRPPINALDAAALCAERGLHVIPVWRPTATGCSCPRGAQCISPGKHPAIDSWQTAASTDLTVLRDWFPPMLQTSSDPRDAERYNIGIVCGPSGVVCIDIDPRNAGDETFAALLNELGPLPDTATADSGGGGTHYVFRRPTGELESKLGKGVDLLRDSRQFLVEPSMHPSGGMYRWRAGRAPDEIAIADLPAAWVERLRRRSRRTTTHEPIPDTLRAERARAYIAKMPAAVSGDNGHTALFNVVAVAMYGFDLDTGTTRSLVNEYNQRCDPEWSEREIEHKLKHCASTCKRERGYLLKPRVPYTPTASAPQPAEPDTDWAAELLAKLDGTAKRSYHNVEVFVRLFPDYHGRWSLNTMTGEPYFDGRPIKESFAHAMRAHIERRLGFTPPLADVKAAIVVAAEREAFHPVQQYLDSIDWDGVPRLQHVARDYLGADAPVHAEMFRRWMIGAVARALKPGCKFDTALMLHGAQGIGKSTLFATLGGQWHSDSAIDISNKDAYQQIHAAWIYEFSELENVVSGRAESRLKAFITSTHDMFRAPYAAQVTSRARSVALCGTTNRDEILTDDTGSRRFWIIPVRFVESIAGIRDQLWAEARAAYEAGEPWWFDAELEQQREEGNQDFETDDSWMTIIRDFLATPRVADVDMDLILRDALKIDPGRRDRGLEMRASRVLRRLGWSRRRIGPRSQRRWIYVRT